MAAARLPQHPCVAAAALARCRTDPARAARGRRPDRRDDHADGRRAGHRPDDRDGAGADRRTGDRRDVARQARRGRRHRHRRHAGDARAGLPLAVTPQPDDGSTYAAKIERAEAAIDWRAGAAAIDRQVRAFDPAPGAFTAFAGDLVKLWRADAADGRGGAAGTIVAAGPEGLVVACGEGLLRINELQPAGGRRMDAAAFVAGRRVAPGQRFDVSVVPTAAPG